MKLTVPVKHHLKAHSARRLKGLIALQSFFEKTRERNSDLLCDYRYSKCSVKMFCNSPRDIG